jgi:hypothetical protein
MSFTSYWWRSPARILGRSMARPRLASSFEARWIPRSLDTSWAGVRGWDWLWASRKRSGFWCSLRVNALCRGRRGWRFLVCGVGMAATTWSAGHLSRRARRTALAPGRRRAPSTSVKYFTGLAHIRSFPCFGGCEGLISSLKERCPQPQNPNPASASSSPCTTPALSPPGPNGRRFWGSGRTYPP